MEIEYLCYDVRGIQRFIFGIPLLKAIIGGSALIEQFDVSAEKIANDFDIECIFCGGGRGAFQGFPAKLANFKKKLIAKQNESGFDLQFGQDKDITIAIRDVSESYGFVPEDLSGVPCPQSGFYPVKNNRPHELIRKRIKMSQEFKLDKDLQEYLEKEYLEKHVQLPSAVRECKLRFIRSVTASEISEDDDDAEERRTKASRNAMGKRNRWATCSVDANMAGQPSEQFKDDPAMYLEWLKFRSESMSKAMKIAFQETIEFVVSSWIEEHSRELSSCIVQEDSGQKILMLPFRPIILAGDQATFLCHCDYALDMVKKLTEIFAEKTEKAAGEWSRTKPGMLWPATENRLTLSGGVLFSKTSLPLSLTIPYADKLVARAKGKFFKENKALPSAIDFDVVTDSMIDHPSVRCRREFEFRDQDLENKTISLSNRPYRFDGDPKHPDSWQALLHMKKQLEELPKSIRSQLIASFRQSWSDRTEYILSVSKRHPELQEMFMGDWDHPGSAWHLDEKNKDTLVTNLADAILLLEEDHRVKQGAAAHA